MERFPQTSSIKLAYKMSRSSSTKSSLVPLNKQVVSVLSLYSRSFANKVNMVCTWCIIPHKVTFS